MRIVPFRPQHINLIKIQKEQLHLPNSAVEYYDEFISSGEAYTVVHDHRILGCGGISKVVKGKVYLWALLSEYARDHMISITKITIRFANMHRDKVILALVRPDFEDGLRWMKILKFSLNQPAPGVFPDGSDGLWFERL